MAANNMNQLNNMLMKELRKAMTVASDKMLADMYGETGKFYTKGNPKIYKRTGALGDTPKTSPLTSSLTSVGGVVSFNAYLDQTHQYTTGTFTMGQVLERAESTHFRAGILGKPKFWQASEKKMERTFNQTMRKFFKKI